MRLFEQPGFAADLTLYLVAGDPPVYSDRPAPEGMLGSAVDRVLARLKAPLRSWSDLHDQLALLGVLVEAELHPRLGHDFAVVIECGRMEIELRGYVGPETMSALWHFETVAKLDAGVWAAWKSCRAFLAEQMAQGPALH